MAEPGAADVNILMVIATAIERISASLEQLNQQQGPAQYRGLDVFCRRNPPKFEGGFAPEAADDWIQELEKIFRVLMCTEEQKVTYATYMLSKEAENWWNFTKQQLDYENQVLTWAVFKDRFLQKYFPADLKIRKEMEFLHLQQGNMSVGEYAAKFEDLARYAPHYNRAGNEWSKCVKFEDGLRPDLKVTFGHQQIPDFATLVNKCRIYEDNIKARDAELKKILQQRASYGPQRNFSQGHGGEKFYNHNKKPYDFPSGSQQRDFENQKTEVPPQCLKCGGGHFNLDCPRCYYCKQVGHIRSACPKRKLKPMDAVQVAQPQTRDKVFDTNGAGSGAGSGEAKNPN